MYWLFTLISAKPQTSVHTYKLLTHGLMGECTQSLCCLAAGCCERGPAVRRRAGFREESGGGVMIAGVGVCAYECV